jgi:glycosyltransferase involved in cell wall biosynthesis
LTALQQQSLNKANFEVLVVSDGPDAQTGKIVRQFEKAGNFRYLSLPQKKGPAAARNLGWLSARASVIAFTDDDCLPDTLWLEKILNIADPSQPMAFTGRVVVPCGERPTDFELNTAGLETADFVTANCACTKLALIATGGFDERFSMAWREDSDLEFKLISNAIPIIRIVSAIVVHPVREAQWGVSVKEQKKTLFNALLYRKYPELYRRKIQAQPPYLYYLIISGFLAFIIGSFFNLPSLAAAGTWVWLLLTTYFIFKRLYRTSLSGKHVAEMIVTSFLIPFYSIYWQWYGAVKYRILLI